MRQNLSACIPFFGFGYVHRDHKRNRVRVRMAETNLPLVEIQVVGKLGGHIVQAQMGPPPVIRPDFNIRPTHITDAGTKRFSRRFFSRETRRQPRRDIIRLFALGRREKAREKPFAVPFHRALDALYLDHVYTDSQHNAVSPILFYRSFRPGHRQRIYVGIKVTLRSRQRLLYCNRIHPIGVALQIVQPKLIALDSENRTRDSLVAF